MYLLEKPKGSNKRQMLSEGLNELSSMGISLLLCNSTHNKEQACGMQSPRQHFEETEAFVLGRLYHRQK